MLHLNPEDLNFDLYFEFYLSNDLFFRYTYACNQTEFTLRHLVEDITHHIIPDFQYRLFTGYEYDHTITTFKLNATKDERFIMNYDQDERSIKDFPLNLASNESLFSDHLHLQVLIALNAFIEPLKFREKLFPYINLIQSKSINPIWPVMYTDQVLISPLVVLKINKLNHRLEILKRYKNAERLKEMKLNLANELLAFQKQLDSRIERTLNLYSEVLKLLQKDILNLLRPLTERKEQVFRGPIQPILGTNEHFLQYCYGDVDQFSDETLIEYIKYFTLTHYINQNLGWDPSIIRFNFRTRYREISELKTKIVESITVQIEKVGQPER